MQASFILSWVITIGLATSPLPPIQNTPPITMTDLLQALNFLHGEIWLTYYMWLVLDMERF
jgi:hypothetical protein